MASMVAPSTVKMSFSTGFSLDKSKSIVQPLEYPRMSKKSVLFVILKQVTEEVFFGSWMEVWVG